MPKRKKPAKRALHDPAVVRWPPADVVSLRRKLCSLLRFWKFCGHRPCRRAQSCAHPTNECFGRFWPAAPDWLRQGLHAGVRAKTAGLPPAEIDAAVARAIDLYRDAPSPFETLGSTPQAAAVTAAPPCVAAPARAFPRARVL
jgi:hypothetical protein